jgi:hypothetical protein
MDKNNTLYKNKYSLKILKAKPSGHKVTFTPNVNPNYFTDETIAKLNDAIFPPLWTPSYELMKTIKCVYVT